MCSRFVVHAVDSAPPVAEEKLRTHKDLERSWVYSVEKDKKFAIEKSSTVQGPMLHTFYNRSCLAEAVSVSFFEHRPLRLSPDCIWLTLLQGLAIHMQGASEENRVSFVDFEGKKDLVLVRPDIMLGRDDNDWTGAIQDFLSSIRTNIKSSNHFLTDTSFSTTTFEDTIAKNVAVMDITKHFFRMSLMGGCGIPWIELTGTPEDWILLRIRAEELGQYGLDWWMTSLLPVLDRFARAAQGDVDVNFFRAAVFKHGGSGSTVDPCTGWIQALYPYTASYKPGEYHRNSKMDAWQADTECTAVPTPKPSGEANGMQLWTFPTGINTAPFTFINMATGEKTEMLFAGGLVAVMQNENDGALELRSGWAILKAE